MKAIRIKPIKKVTYIQLLLLHLALAFSVYLFPFTSQFIFLGVCVFFFFLIVTKANKNDEALLAAAYITGAELFFRMTGGAFFYESGKYLVILFLLMGIFLNGTSKKTIPYWIYLFLLVPGVLFSAMNLNYDTNIRTTIAFNISGPVTVGIVGIYCFYRKISAKRIHHIFLAILLPIITLTFYLFVYTPSIRDSLSGTASNFAASGGFGPNQVATIMGLGAIILFIRLFTIKSRLVNIIDLFLLAFVCYRGLVTFSRGGMISALICCVAFFIIYFYMSDALTKAKLLPKIVGILGILFITWLFTSIQTLGLLDKRYNNQDAAGRVKQDVTTGRAELMATELDAFFGAPLTGVGIGKIKEYREEKTGVSIATHNELSRLISEHGVPGLIALFILVVSPLFYWLAYKPSVYFFAFYFFWLLTISHSSMRLAASGFIYGLCLLYIINEKNTLHRKPAKTR
ncbi:MAG: O-antigen ligase family protein [Flavobacteriaceae bacterium]